MELDRNKIGKYDVLEVLGRGGMGVVYKAMDSRIGRLVAIKMMTGEVSKDPDFLKRFYREAQSTGILQHPNIVVVHDLGEEDGNPYLVMEFLEGIALDKVIAARAQLSLFEKLGLMIQVCEGLHYAHQRGIVHRDIKPGNIMVLRDRTVKIVDFGIARIGNTSMTRTGQVIGTINYMSPEQINALPVDGRSDLFSTAVVLYELLTFALPFDGKDTTTTIMKILQDAPPPLHDRLADCPAEMEEILLRALAKERDERYATCGDFALDLSRVRERMKKQMLGDFLERGKACMERSDFIGARDMLQQVLQIDAQHAVAKQLLSEVQERFIQQQRREQLRQLSADAEDAYNRRLYDDALGLVQQAIMLDKTSTDLQGLQQKVQEAKARRDQLDACIRRAQAAQQTGDLPQAQKAVEEALSFDPTHTQALSLQAALLKRVAGQGKTNELAGMLENARNNMNARRYTVALELLKNAQQIDPSNTEVQALLRQAEMTQQQELRRRDLDVLSQQIQDALTQQDAQTAWQKCNEALAIAPNDPVILNLRAQAEKLRAAQAPQTAAPPVPMAAMPTAAGTAPMTWGAAAQTAPQPAPPLPMPAAPSAPVDVTPPLAPQPAKGGGGKVLVLVAVVVLIVILGVAAFFLKGKLGAGGQTAAGKGATTGSGAAYIEVYAVPWGAVKSLTSADGSTRAVNEYTPVRLMCPPGEYTIVVYGPGGQEQSKTLKVTNDAPGKFQPVFGNVNVDEILTSK